ncbi:carbohydrate binding domain-containing protein [Paenibacillus sp. NEAU-GSW1]|uniref:carbohydrate binding domain-containing protein n=1 Tax=Paenibacillus sp. NEAU-GSW1 TaxID=2682486 RepID=UPI0012E20ECB|nr:carbohydrate binding domain-containing protein [Paenibacillus sp. NEAU-GSW1]MUT68359.1 family 16 glycosylhydrolase [Paenibacillus sp. NEAU-GSW1]
MFKKRLSQLIACSLFVSLAAPVAGVTHAAESSKVPSFVDMKGHWAESAVSRMSSFGVVSGYEGGEFKPGKQISRAEFITMLDRVFGFAGHNASSFTDVQSGEWYYDAVTRASGSGIVKGVDTQHFEPDAMITREDAAVMLDRTFELSKGSESDALLKQFDDYTAVSSYAKKAISYLTSEGVMKGYNGLLQPKASITRAESAVLLSGMIGDLITEPGEYNASQVDGNLIIRTTGVTVNSTKVNGSLLLTEGIGEGDVTLDGVTVNGSTVIKGGGIHSIVFDNSQLKDVSINKQVSPVRVVFRNRTHAGKLYILQPAQFESSDDSDAETIQVEADNVMVNGESVPAGTVLPSVSGTDSTTNPPSSSAEKPVPSTTIPDKDWKLVWNDEFSGSSIDTNKWSVMDTGLVYNNEMEYYKPDNAVIEKDGKRGVLSLKAKKEEYGGKDYTSAKLITQNKGDWTYGKVVVRAKLPIQQGMWPAIWMMPTDEAHYGGWPASGEIDIMELIGGANANRIYGNIHYDSVQADGTHGSDQSSYVLQDGATFADEYHDFQVEWLPGVIRFYVDGQLYHEVKDWKTKAPDQPEYYTYPAPFDRPFYLILNLAVGGDWPGSPNDDFTAEQMNVDFVRVYEYKKMDSLEDVTGKPPVPEPQRNPQADGNLLYNEQFTQTVDEEGVPQYWKFLLNEGGTAQIAVVDDENKGKAAKVSITNAGSQLYSVQLTQMPVYLQKGKKYKVTYDAKADAPITIMSKVNQFEKSWKNYSGEHYSDLTTDWASYEYTFDMLENTDNNARFEFNLGNNAQTSAYFANVKLIEIGDADITVERSALPDGNLIYNGTFDQGSNRLAFWSTKAAEDAAAQFSVNNFLAFPIYERQLVVDVTDGGTSAESISVSQPDLVLEKNSGYGIYFDAKADTTRDMTVDLVSSHPVMFPGGKTISLGTTMQTYALETTIGDGADQAEAELKLLFGGAEGTVYVDNVRLVKRGNPITLDGYTHIPAASAWEMQGLQLENSSEGGKHVAWMDEGDTLRYKINVERSGEYAISARVASGQSDSQIRLQVKDESGGVISNTSYDLGSTEGWQKYETVYLESVQLETGNSYYLDFEGYDYNTLWIDLSPNIVVNGNFDNDLNGWNLNPGEPASMTRSNEGELIAELPGTSANWWDYTVQQSNVNIEKGKSYRLEFDASASSPKTVQVVVSQSSGDFTKYLEDTAELTSDREHYAYSFTMTADTDPSSVLVFGLGNSAVDEGQHTVAIDRVRLYEVNASAESGGQPINVNLLQNGDFTNGTNGWFSYSPAPSELSIAANNGGLEASIGSVGTNAWDRQVIQEGFSIQQGHKYEITFTAKAGTTRKLGLGIGWVDVPAGYEWHGYYGQQVDLTTEEQTFTFAFDVTADSNTNSRIVFDMGNIAGGNAGNTVITISDVKLVNLGPI